MIVRVRPYVDARTYQPRYTLWQRFVQWLNRPAPAPLFKARNPHWVLAVRRALRRGRR